MSMQWLKHAFAMEKASDIAPTDEQKEIVDKLCRWVAERRLTTPGIMALEMSRPLNFYIAHVLHFFRPAIAALLDTRSYQQFSLFLEHRGSVDYICRRLEHFEAELDARHESPADDGESADSNT